MRPYDISDLISETDPIRRNEMALAISAKKSPNALKVLIDLISKPDLKNNRGTLVYCLRYFEYAEYLPLIANLVIEGNWEVAHEAFSLINDLDFVEGKLVKESFDILKSVNLENDLEPWRANLIADLLDMFE